MKKIIGYIGAYFFFHIGNFACKISHFKVKGEFFFDRKRYSVIGYFLARRYQKWMHLSYNIQKWAGNKTPWNKVQK